MRNRSISELMSTAFTKGTDVEVPFRMTIIHNLFTAVLSLLVEAEKNKKSSINFNSNRKECFKLHLISYACKYLFIYLFILKCSTLKGKTFLTNYYYTYLLGSFILLPGLWEQLVESDECSILMTQVVKIQDFY